MSVVNAASSSIDPWDDPIQSSSKLSARRTPAQVVPDDWDVEDEDEQDGRDNQKIWEDANTKAPMPQVILAPSRTQTIIPPPSAFQAPIRILKRTPTSSTPSGASSPSPSPGPGTYAERSARYNAARERIFADGKSGTGSEGRQKTQDSMEREGEVQGQVIIRNPTGPGAEPGEGGTAGASKGFGGRRKRKGNGRGSGEKASSPESNGARDQFSVQR